MSKLPCLVMAAAIVLPFPAFADCAARISAVENNPILVDGGAAEQAPPLETAAPPAAGSDNEKIVKEEVVGDGDAVREDGGTTVYQDGGPAAPRESWFTDEKDRAVVLTYLDAAKTAQAEGDETACIESIEQAEKALSEGTG